MNGKDHRIFMPRSGMSHGYFTAFLSSNDSICVAYWQRETNQPPSQDRTRAVDWVHRRADEGTSFWTSSGVTWCHEKVLVHAARKVR